MSEVERLRQVLLDIAAAGGWQGRFAQEALDADPLPVDATGWECEACGWVQGADTWDADEETVEAIQTLHAFNAALNGESVGLTITLNPDGTWNTGE